MKRTPTFAALLAVAAGMLACQQAPPPAPGAPPTEAEIAMLQQRVDKYFRTTAGLAPEVSLLLRDVTATETAEWLVGRLEVSSGTENENIPMVLSRDGRYAVAGELIDLVADPFAIVARRIAVENHPMRGNPNAPVTIVEYSDFQCPFCASAFRMLEDEVLKKYGDRVRFVFKNFPLSALHPWADAAALAVACVRDRPDAFWKLHDFFFAHQAEITADNLREKARTALADTGVDADQFAECMETEAAMPLVRADKEEAAALGVRSTPTFFINGRRIEGAVPGGSLAQLIDQALATAPAGGGS